jgi:CO/xanthine dehydrogenase Mo-binding subunit
LKLSGSLAVGFSLPQLVGCSNGNLTGRSGAGALQRGSAGLRNFPAGANVANWLVMDRTGHVTLLVGKVELGTGVQTALSQIAADELDVSFDAIRVIAGETGITPNQGLTAGSQTIESGAVPLRRAAAQARRLLLAAAAKQLGADIDTLGTNGGRVMAPGERSISYGDLIATADFNQPLADGVPLKNSRDYQYVGVCAWTSLPKRTARSPSPKTCACPAHGTRGWCARLRLGRV